MKSKSIYQLHREDQAEAAFMYGLIADKCRAHGLNDAEMQDPKRVDIQFSVDEDFNLDLNVTIIARKPSPAIELS